VNEPTQAVSKTISESKKVEEEATKVICALEDAAMKEASSSAQKNKG
jgi:hypothetical protein